MSRNINLAKLLPVKNALKRKPENVQASVAAISPEALSPYFSPVKTRNQRKHIKIQTEETLTKKPISKIVAKAVIKQETLDAIEAIASPSKPKQKIKVEANNVKKEVVDAVDDAAVVDVAKKPKKADSVESKPLKLKSKPKVKLEAPEIKKEIADDTPMKDESEAEEKWQPKNWKQLIENIREMRKTRSAPVDTMGCHKCCDETASEKVQRFHHLVALMLSSQTKDTVTFEAMKRLKQRGLTPEAMCEIDAAELEKLLVPVGFYKRKAIYIKNTAKILIDKYDSDIPDSIEEMVNLPGVGPKMAHICMRVAWGVISGIGVDTHVHRISNRLQWMPKATKEPEQTRVALESWLPRELWSEVNELLVGFGQTICTPTNPKCGECLNYDICPSKVVKKKK